MTGSSQQDNSTEADQLLALRKENRSLRKRLDDWTQRVLENEKISKRLQRSELKVLAAQTIAQIAEVVVDDIGQGNGSIITLVVHDPEFELQRIIDAEQQPGLAQCVIPIHDMALITPLLPPPYEPCFDPLSAEVMGRLFPRRSNQVKSTLLMPLVQGGELIGSLNFGNSDEQAYERGMATDIIERLAAIVAIAVQNMLNQYRLRQAGLTDPLTMLNNRRFFEQRLLEEFDRAVRTQRPLCCLMIDIDYFKQVNDTHGHQVGDKVLQRVSQTMVDQMRRTDVLARYGGEEFVAERLRQVIEKESISIEGNGEISITISIGMSVLDSHLNGQDTPKTLVAYADQALYNAKHRGRNRVEKEIVG
ncbi:MAG: sensor domain-containing diguanylate cyclase [Gammaproteobacteria bacterium]